ncbi:hypothetical protein P9112_008907 [Eukaryota sp. TZLM1-RC]
MTHTKQVIGTIRDVPYNTALDSPTVSCLRINVSHCSVDQVVSTVTKMSKLANLRRVFLDLQGPKLRVSAKQPTIELRTNTTVPLVSSNNFVHSGDACIVLDQREIDALSQHSSSNASLDDGKILISLSTSTMTAKVTRGGVLKPSKGLNLSPHPAVVTLTEKDRKVVEQTRHFPFVAYALSFTRSLEDIIYLKSMCHNFVAAKIELPLSMETLSALLPVCDELWLCRGDLGSQLGLKELGKYFKQFKHFTQSNSGNIEKFILAGEVLEHMFDHPIPTRSEVCHLAEMMDVFGGIVLSNECFGHYLPEIISFLTEFLD